MLTVKSNVDMAAALASSHDPHLKSLLTLRHDQLLEGSDLDIGSVAHFVIAGPGDPIGNLDAELGFPVAVNLVDGSGFGDIEFEPSWEWIERHDEWFELAFILTDDGFAHVLLVPDIEGVDPVLLALCRTYCQFTA
jgi:hypothetical protein